MKRLLTLIPLVLALLIPIACGGEETVDTDTVAGEGQEQVALGSRDVMTVGQVPVTAGVRLTGSLDPAESVELRAQLSGTLDRVPVEEGQAVRQGQVLAVFDSSALRAQLAAAESQLSSANRDLSSSRMLFEAGAISERDYTQARVAHDAAASQVAQIRESLSRSTVTSPISGTLTQKFVSQGEAVQPGTALFNVANTEVLELNGTIRAEEIGRVRVGQQVSLSLEAYPGRAISGTVDRIDPVADPQTRQVDVYVRVPNAGGLVGGLFATGTILTGDEGGDLVPSVPLSAIIQKDGNTFVYRISDGRLEQVPILLGDTDTLTGVVEVRSGLEAGDRIVVSPSPDLEPGAAVRVESSPEVN